MHRILVEEKRWISERDYLHALNLLHAATRTGGASADRLHGLADVTAFAAASLPAPCSFCPV
jgi:chromate transport protein ChrA